MLVEKSKSSDNQSLKYIWADYRKKEVQVESNMDKDVNMPESRTETILKEETLDPAPEIRKASCEVEKIGDKIVKIRFTEYKGKRRKKVTHVEVTQAQLDQMLKESKKPMQVQYEMF